jgi:hypothetical protein
MLTRPIDAVLRRIRWPIAVGLVACLPFLTFGFFFQLTKIGEFWHNVVPLVIGLGAFLFAWQRFLRSSKWTDWFLRFEHEATHAIFAWLTGHKVIGFKNSLTMGSEVEIQGQGNWLITSAPYFFPTFAVALWLLSLIMPIPILPWTNLFLGLALGLHLVSTIRETHSEQDDLKQLGRPFVWMFLPSANLAMLGILISFSLGGFAGIGDFVMDCTKPITWLVSGGESETSKLDSDRSKTTTNANDAATTPADVRETDQ